MKVIKEEDGKGKESPTPLEGRKKSKQTTTERENEQSASLAAKQMSERRESYSPHDPCLLMIHRPVS